jgi:3-isopropylmalate/(R)-2-methylmalate dehydratase small subunit
MTVDLLEQTIRLEADGREFHFDIEASRKDALVRGLDAVRSTLAAYSDDIHTFELRHRTAYPWLFDRPECA